MLLSTRRFFVLLNTILVPYGDFLATYLNRSVPAINMVNKEDHGARRLGEMTALGSSIIFLSLAIAFLAVGSGSMTLFLAAGYVLIYAVTAAIRLAHFKERPKKRTYGNIL